MSHRPITKTMLFEKHVDEVFVFQCSAYKIIIPFQLDAELNSCCYVVLLQVQFILVVCDNAFSLASRGDSAILAIRWSVIFCLDSLHRVCANSEALKADLNESLLKELGKSPPTRYLAESEFGLHDLQSIVAFSDSLKN